MDFPFEPKQCGLLTLGELEALSCSCLPVFLTLFHARIAGNESRLLEGSAIGGIYFEKSLGDAMLDGSGLTGIAATLDRDEDVEFVDIFGELKRLTDNHLGSLTAEIGIDRLGVYRDNPGAWCQPYACYRGLSFAGAVIFGYCHFTFS
jgi:hypothetical protein